MSRNDFTLSVLGSRGSMSHADPALALYGGDSSCYLVRAGEESVFLDAGSGMLHAPARYPRTPAVLLSHLHLDHLIGLGMFPGLMVRGQGLRILVPFCSDREAAERSLERVYAPPFWPIRLSQGECGVELLPLAERFAVGELAVETMVGNHPGGGMLFKLSYRGRSLIYATDYEHEERTFEALTDFARGADLLLYDAQYTESEYPAFRGFGHSTAEKGLELFARCGAGQMLLVHHSPGCTDEVLLAREKLLPPRVSYARQGQVIPIG